MGPRGNPTIILLISISTKLLPMTYCHAHIIYITQPSQEKLFILQGIRIRIEMHKSTIFRELETLKNLFLMGCLYHIPFPKIKARRLLETEWWLSLENYYLLKTTGVIHI